MAEETKKLPDIPQWMEAQGAVINEPRRWPQAMVRSTALVIMTLLAICYTLYFAQTILFPVVLACVLSFVFRPVHRWLCCHKVPNVLAATLIVGGVGLIAVGAGSQLVGPAASWIDKVPTSVSQVEHRLSFLKRPVQKLSRATRELENLSRPGKDRAVEVEVKDSRLSQMVFHITGNVIVGLVFTFVLLFFLLVSGETIFAKIGEIATERATMAQLSQMLLEIERCVSRYLLTYVVINTCLGVAIGTALWLIGLPNPMLWGAMAGLLNFIPYVGATIGASIVGLAALLTFDSPSYALLAPGAYVFLNGLEGQVITPAIMGKSMDLSPLVVLLSLTFWGWLWGIGGALIAVPLLAILKIICDHVPQLRPCGILLSA